VVVDNVVVIQHLVAGHPVRDNAEAFLNQLDDGAAVDRAETSTFCVWQLPAPATSPATDSLLRARGPWTLRLGDQFVVHARLENVSGIIEGQLKKVQGSRLKFQELNLGLSCLQT
jgi:hypothetical protein